ncbi:DEK domain-containing chromatin-associated protein 1-like isoform X2 [Amaranthus tricolor]|uniref:DEK domain-containing chromatin-associated protein 1-like isoform X2 n=1 Tax=Amaranthus tricolor TaxID=29722 RepID=UPI0025886763|nr:DEK domain-containing chromatin-associated protein 1-like isoform X2 [Amaranthus tricolor]
MATEDVDKQPENELESGGVKELEEDVLGKEQQEQVDDEKPENELESGGGKELEEKVKGKEQEDEVDDEKPENELESGGGKELEEEIKGEEQKQQVDCKKDVEVKDDAKEEKKGKDDVKKENKDKDDVKEKIEDKEDEEEEKKVNNGKRDRKKADEELEVQEQEDREEKKFSKKMKPTPPSGPKEATTPIVDRPTRERKSVDRYLSAPLSRSPVTPLSIAKGSGRHLKDIPNVAYKLSKRKPDDNLQMLHTILFGKKAKAHNLKKDIGQFSGFVWVDNEEKQRAKTKEKLDKCVKEKLLDFCDLLNIPINKSSTKKEYLSVKLLEFLESPQATTDVLLADKEQDTKKKKKKATPESSKASFAKNSAKNTLTGKKWKRREKEDEYVDADDIDDNEDSGQDIDSDQEEEGAIEMMINEGSLTKGNSEAEDGNKSTKTKRSRSEKTTKRPAKSAKKTTSAPDKSLAAAGASASCFKAKGSSSKKKQVEEETNKEKPIPVEDKSSGKKQRSNSAAKSAIKDQGKGKSKEEAKSEPTNDEIRAQTEILLKEVDFDTATLSDILQRLGTHFGMDLMHRKVEFKALIIELIENMANEEVDNDNGEDAEDSGKD